MHALNVSRAVPLLSFKAHFGVSCVEQETTGVGKGAKPAITLQLIQQVPMCFRPCRAYCFLLLPTKTTVGL